MLDWHGAPIILGRGKSHVVTYADIVRDLEPLNEGRDNRDRITYDSLWIHAKRHYDIDGIAGYWESQMVKELKHALRRSGRRPIEQQRAGCSKYEKFHGHRDCAYRYVEHDLALRSRA